MKDLISALENNEDKYHIIIDEEGYKIILDRAKIEASTSRILKKYNIASQKFLRES